MMDITILLVTLSIVANVSVFKTNVKKSFILSYLILVITEQK